MRSWFLVCAVLSAFALTSGRTVVAHAADAKAKGGKKKGDEVQDSTGIGKTLQWEDKVMGPDDKGAELDKIRKAQAINKAAAEKAEKEKAANAAREAKEREAAAKAGPTTQKRGGEVALPTLPDEGPSGGSGGKKAQHTEVSPKLETEAAKAPPPAMKPADDKFIDKLLKEEGGSKKKRASAAEDKALVDMLAVEKPGKAATGKKGKKDGVDDLLNDADKAAPMPETKVKHETPEWAKPEIRERAYTPPPAPVATKKEQPNDGIIRVVQGAAGSSSGSAKPAVATSTTTRTPPAPAGSGTRKQAAAINSRPGEWADPFSDPSPRKGGKQVAAKRPVEAEEDDFRPAARRNASAPAKREASRASGSGDWDDPFSDGARKTTGTRRAVPTEAPSKPTKAAPARGARGGKWDDPFTSDEASKSGRPAVASREVGKHGAKGAVTPTATHRAAAAPAAPAQGRWGALKKRR